MPTSVRLDPAVEARLDQLAQATGRSKAYYPRE
ncbi:MAG: ribbon-helix-helix protein, CopG family, partial [Cyanobacteria bacterium]|nr:ribbon-helix-helix protein, CopG family [Cyanobacteria bacterium bin.275]